MITSAEGRTSDVINVTTIMLDLFVSRTIPDGYPLANVVISNAAKLAINSQKQREARLICSVVIFILCSLKCTFTIVDLEDRSCMWGPFGHWHVNLSSSKRNTMLTLQK